MLGIRTPHSPSAEVSASLLPGKAQDEAYGKSEPDAEEDTLQKCLANFWDVAI
jgi:hypothetical protein